jgi:cholest-4-en-3-one 26-monooxygenase
MSQMDHAEAARELEGFNFIDPDRLQSGIPMAEFALLRRNAPVWWNAEDPETGPFRDGGFWVISRHRDVRAISRNSDDWSANAHGVIMSYPDHVDPSAHEQSKAMIINQDPPMHTRLRQIVSRMFTPRGVAALEDTLREAAHKYVAEAAEKGSGDFIADIASRLPLDGIAELLGVPQADRDEVLRWANATINFADPDPELPPIIANANLVGYAYNMAEKRRKQPADDIVTRLVNADIDGEHLTELEFSFFVIILAVAGNDTSRNAIGHGMNAFLDNPDQWELFKRERPPATADEIVRWATPIHCFQRTALRDVEIEGIKIRKGQRVGMFYSSANYDETVFDDPHRFDITRDPNPHLGFGGSGIHYCLGANLARMEIRLIFETIADIIPDIAKLGEPQRTRSGLINSLRSFEVQYR